MNAISHNAFARIRASQTSRDIATIAALTKTNREIATLATFTRECVASDMQDLSARQTAILLHAHQNLGLSVKAFAEAMNINKPAVTRVLDRLTELGLVTRGVAADDKRMVAVWMTEKGAAHVEAMGRALRGVMS